MVGIGKDATKPMPIYMPKRFSFSVESLLYFIILNSKIRKKMMGSVLSRALIMPFAYAYPAYECFKAVEKTKPEIDQLLQWCQYWILIAMLTICERIGDNLISWLPMYYETKLALFIYLWHHKTKGSLYVYNSFFRPFARKHETEIDNCLLELRMKGGQITLLFWEKAANYGNTKLSEILQYASSLTVSSTHSPQEPKAANDKPDVSEAISQRQCREAKSNLNQQHQPCSDQLPSTENGNSEISQQQTFHKKSVQTTHRRWRLFKKSS